MAKIVKIFFDGVEKECLVQTSDNGEIVCTARDGQFIKFPKGSDVDAEVARHNADESNTVVPVSGEEVAARDAELHDWLEPSAREARNLKGPEAAIKDIQIIEAGDVGSVEEVLGMPKDT